MSIQTTADEIRDEFAFLDDWEDRYAHIIDMGKSHPGIAPQDQTEANRVRGCASQVWFVSEPAGEDGTLAFRAGSDAILVSGLIALLLRLYNHRKAEDILAFDAAAFLEEIGVTGALTAQRANGLASMLARIKADATALSGIGAP